MSGRMRIHPCIPFVLRTNHKEVGYLLVYSCLDDSTDKVSFSSERNVIIVWINLSYLGGLLGVPGVFNRIFSSSVR